MQDRTLALVAGLCGIALGVSTRIADNQEHALTWLGSLTAPWVLLSFALGALSVSWPRAFASASGAMLCGVSAYYLWMRFADGGVNLSYFLSITAFWLLLAPATGVVFGLAGWVWRRSGAHWVLRALSTAIPGGLIAGESAFMVVASRELTDIEITLLCLVITGGFMMPLALLRQRRERLAGAVMAVLFLLLGLATVPLIRWLISGIGFG